MKTFNGILGLFLVVGLFLTPAPVQADYSLQDAVDIVLTAVGSQSVDPGLSTALGAAPGAIKSGLLFKCNQNRQRINLELTNHPPNSMQLIEESNRNQAIISAIYGDPGPLRKLIKERNKKIADQKKKKKAEERAEEKDSMEFQLDQYQKKIDQLKALKDQILKDGRFALGMVESSLRDAKDIQDELNQYVFFISSLTDRGEKLCVEARLLRQKMIALAVAVADGEALVNTKVNLAKGRKANCKTAEDGLFVKNNYLAAQKALATIKKAKEAAFEYLLEINIKLEPILFQAGYLTIRESREAKRGGYEYLLAAPNKEVQLSFNDILIDFLTDQTTDKIRYQDQLYTIFETGDLEALQTTLSSLFASIPYNNYVNNTISSYEGYFASVIYAYLASLGLEIIAEDVTSRGRIDLTISLGGNMYILEFKVDGRGGALEQIKERNYQQKYIGKGKKIYLVGIDFSSEEKNISGFEWELAGCV